MCWVLLAAWLSLAPVLWATPAGAVPLEPGKRELFLDDHVLEKTENLTRSFHRPRKRGVVLKADIPSDGTLVQTVSAPMWIPDEEIYNLSVSKDFVNWSEPRFLFSTDDEDQRMALDVIRRRLADPGLAKPLMVDPDPATGWTQPPGKFRNRGTWNVQCYNIGVFPYEGVHLGWLMFFYPTGIRLPEKTNTDGFNEMQLAMTRDFKTWKRLGNRQPFIATSRLDEGLVGNYDRLQLNVTNQPVDRGDELWFYYTGMKRRVPQHDRYRNGAPRDPSTLSAEERADWIEDTLSAVYVSVLRRDGFISLDAEETGGFLLTKPLKMAGDRLFLNLQAPAGEAHVEVLDETGRAVPGFGLDDSAAAGGDQVRVAASWKGRDGLSGLAGRTVRLKIHFRDASLYSFWTE